QTMLRCAASCGRACRTMPARGVSPPPCASSWRRGSAIWPSTITDTCAWPISTGSGAHSESGTGGEMGRLEGRVALVTGAAGGGTGGAVVEEFVAEGASVILVDNRADVLAERVAALAAAGHRVEAAAASITDRDALRAAVAPAVERLG